MTQHLCLTFSVILCLCRCTYAELARMRLAGGHIVTSSTLKWVPGDGHLPKHSIPITEDDVSMVWCRAKQHGTYVGGSLKEGVCTAPFLEQVLQVSEGYEVLVSINGSVRIRRVEWDKYSAPPSKSIASSEQQKQYLAFHMDKEGFAHAGYLVPHDRRVHLVEEGHVKKVDEAFVLVEDEPKSYDLQAISLDQRHSLITENEEVLQKLELINEESSPQQIAKTAKIVVRHAVYWGQVKGTLIGRKAWIVGPKPEREEREITWGVQNEYDSVHSIELEYELPPGTSTTVSVVGTFRKTEAPYVGTLTAIYEDGDRLSRVIEGLHIDERLLMLKAIYAPPIFIHNNTELDMEEKTDILYKSTTTTTTTSTTTTTIPTTSTGIPDPPWVSMIRPEQSGNDSSPTPRETRQNGARGSVTNATYSFTLVVLLILSAINTKFSTVTKP